MAEQETDKHLRASEDAMLDQLFAEATANTPEPSPELTARILGDAMDHRPVAGAASNPSRGWLATLFAAIGGIPGAGGLATAGIVGLWIGVSPPEILEINASGLWDYFGTDLTASWGGYGDIL